MRHMSPTGAATRAARSKRRRDATVRSQGTQVLMGASAPMLYFALAASRAGLAQWVRVQHLCTSALLAFISACAGAFKLRCVRCALAWRAAPGCDSRVALVFRVAESSFLRCCT